MIYIIVVNILIGIGLGILITKGLGRRKYDGTIAVTKNDEKIVYTLEVDLDPEKIQFRDKVLFKVEDRR